MTDPSVVRIRESFERIAPRLDQLVERFYTTLFERCPDVRELFPPDMTRQRAHLAAALALIIRNVDRLEMLEEAIMDLGGQHVGFGTRPEHYPAVRDALLAVLAEGMGSEWTPQLSEDWQATLNHVVRLMLRGHAKAVLNIAARIDTWGVPGPSSFGDQA